MDTHKCDECGYKDRYDSWKGIKIPCPHCMCIMSPLQQNKAPASEVPCSAGLRGRLIKAAASLSLYKLSEFDDDYPQRFPKRVLREIEKHNDHLGDIARELMAIKDAL